MRDRSARGTHAHVPGLDCSPPDPLAVQMAQLLSESDADELREIIRRWMAEAQTSAIRKQYEQFGHRLLELKQAIAETGTQPTRAELEFTLTMMLRLASTSGGAPTR